jgi:hypothetical protein
MFPTGVAETLITSGHDARAAASEFRGLPDADVFALAVVERRVVVTENVIDFVALLEDRVAAGHDTTPVVFARKANLPRGAGALASRLAARLDDWAVAHPDPFPTAYWL